MNRFLLQMAAMKEIEGKVDEGSRQAAAQEAVKEQTQALVSIFLKKEALVCVHTDSKSRAKKNTKNEAIN